MIFPRRTEERKVRVFSLSQIFLDQYKNTQPKWGPLGYVTYKRTYSRTKEDGSSEEFWETCKRVVEGVYNIQKIHCRTLLLPWDEKKSQISAQRMYDKMFNFKFLPPGRGLWAMGTDMVYAKGSASLNNCAFVSTSEIDTDFAAPFCFLMDMSMLGVGVGGDTKGVGKVNIVSPKYSDKEYIVEDTREGWVNIVKVVLNAFVGKGAIPEKIDYSKIRPFGTLIKGFGGVASGPQPLIDLIENIKKLFIKEDNEESYKITSSQIVDIFNYIGKCVVSGNVRRTAEIMFGDPNDEEFMSLKQDKDALYDRRWASNNSIYGTVGMDYSKISELMASNGEPGIVWLDNMREYSRMNGIKDYKDIKAGGSNPCSEQTLESFELCCLVETFPNHHDSLEEYLETLKYAYLYAKSVTLVPTHDQRTNAVMARNRRIGCSQSGIVQAIQKLGYREYLNWCDKGYNHIQELDKQYSNWLCIPRSIKTTSVKPSGTVSLLAGATAGIHFPHAEYYIRRIRMQKGTPLVDVCKEAGYEVEIDAYSDNTMVVSFPIKEEHFNKSKDDVSIWQQFALAADIQEHWADNQVSITVTFSKKEIDQIVPCLEHFETKLKSISLLPLLEEDHGYVQTPYEKITKEKYLEMSSKIKPMKINEKTHEVDDKFCDGDNCVL